jgi:hypothetical protein
MRTRQCSVHSNSRPSFIDGASIVHTLEFGDTSTPSFSQDVYLTAAESGYLKSLHFATYSSHSCRIWFEFYSSHSIVGLNHPILDEMEDTKPEISQMEAVEQHHHKHHTLEDLAANEDEPQTPYQLGWRTILALLTLSMGNVCAALSNTVKLFLA